MELTVFYSWQSDLPTETNRGLISLALSQARTALETKHTEEDRHSTIDEATRGAAGSPNIPATIIAKITASDIFVCDVTPINSNTTCGRRVANPNVIFELGYAVAILGWNRVVMLFNKHFGTFPDDLSFDFDRHRGSPYSYGPDSVGMKKTEKAARVAPLATLLETALEAIILAAPQRQESLRHISPLELRRIKDVSQLECILSSLHIPSIDRFLDALPNSFNGSIFYFFANFDGVFNSSLFYIYDEVLRDLLHKFHGKWNAALSLPNRYDYRGPDFLVWVARESDNGRHEEWEQQSRNARSLRDALRNLLDHVRGSYLEVDLDKLSRQAWVDHSSYKAETPAS